MDKNTTFKSKKEAILWIGAILIVILAYVFSLALYGRTLADWWEPLGLALGVSLVVWMAVRGWLIRLWQGTSVYLILLGHMVFMTGVALSVILGLNMWYADGETIHQEQVTVESRYRETHYHSQRVGRRYRQGAPYYTYFLRVKFENGRRKDIEVSLQRYNRTRIGSEITLELETGLLGYPVITSRL